MSRVPIADDLAWANVVRPHVPLVYLDINHYIYFARCQAGDALVPAGYDSLFRAAELASQEGRAIFPLSGNHIFELGGIKDPKQRRSIADVMELLSGFQYLLGRPEIAQLEIEAGIVNLLGESNGPPTRLVGNIFGWAFGQPAARSTSDEEGTACAERRLGADARGPVGQTAPDRKVVRPLARPPVPDARAAVTLSRPCSWSRPPWSGRAPRWG